MDLCRCPQQQWKFEDVGNGTYEVSPRHASTMRLDLRGGLLNNGTPLQLYNDNNTCAQRWVLKPTGATPTGTDVTTLGVKPDDGIDDTMKLQAAADSKKSLYFPAGQYDISNQITFTALTGVTISGAPGAKIVAKSTTPDTPGLFVFNSPTTVAISGLTFVGKHANNILATNWQDALLVNNGQDVTIDGVTASDISGIGISLQSTTRTTIQNSNVFHMGAHGIWGGDSTFITVKNNTVKGLLSPRSRRIRAASVLWALVVVTGCSRETMLVISLTRRPRLRPRTT